MVALVKINQTPTSILLGAQQTFAQTITITQNGYVVLAYYDFRNWTGSPGEIYNNIPLADIPPLQADAWLDIYVETNDPNGGVRASDLNSGGGNPFNFRILQCTY